MIPIDFFKVNKKNPFPLKDEEALNDLIASLKAYPNLMTKNRIKYDSSSKNKILCGNKRLAALIKIGYEALYEEWIEDCADLSKEEKEALILIDNHHHGAYVLSRVNIKIAKKINLKIDNKPLVIENPTLNIGGSKPPEEPPEIPEIKGPIDTPGNPLIRPVVLNLYLDEATEQDLRDKEIEIRHLFDSTDLAGTIYAAISLIYNNPEKIKDLIP